MYFLTVLSIIRKKLQILSRETASIARMLTMNYVAKQVHFQKRKNDLYQSRSKKPKLQGIFVRMPIFYNFTAFKLLMNCKMMIIKMPKYFETCLIVFFLFLFGSSVSAKNPWYSDKDKFAGNGCYLELFGGGVYPNMKFSNAELNSIERKSMFMYDFGMSLRCQMINWFSAGPRLSYFGQGVLLNDNSKYQLKANYIGLQVPLEFQFDLIKKKKGANMKSFFYLAPYLAVPISGTIQTSMTETNIVRGKNIADYNYGAEAGIGVRIPTFSLEDRSNLIFRLSWLQGLSNVFPESGSVPEIGGNGINSAIKLTVCVEIPLKNKKMVSFTAGGDGKKKYKKVVITEQK